MDSREKGIFFCDPYPPGESLLWGNNPIPGFFLLFHSSIPIGGLTDEREKTL